MLEEEKSPFESALQNFSDEKMGIKFGTSRIGLIKHDPEESILPL